MDYSGIIHILAIIGHDVVEHPLGFDSRTLRVEFYGLDISVDSLVPLAALASLIALLVILFCGHRMFRPPLSPPDIRRGNYYL